MRLLAIDPGTTESAWLEYDTDQALPILWAKEPNDMVLNHVAHVTPADLLVIEMFAGYGMPVGREVFESCVWIGRFWQAFLPVPVRLLYRKEIKRHLCGVDRAKDPHVRQALLDKFGPGKELAVGKKASPGPLYGLTGDCWSALAVAVTASETKERT